MQMRFYETISPRRTVYVIICTQCILFDIKALPYQFMTWTQLCAGKLQSEQWICTASGAFSYLTRKASFIWYRCHRYKIRLPAATSNHQLVSIRDMWFLTFCTLPPQNDDFIFFLTDCATLPKIVAISMILSESDGMMDLRVRTCSFVYDRIRGGGGGPRFCRMLKRTYPKSTRPVMTRCLCVRLGVIWTIMCVGRHVISHFEVTESEMLAKINCKNDDGSEKVVYTEDILAVFTHHTKAILFGIGDLWKQFQKSAFYKWVR